jgi:mRNA interferase MazF
MNCSRDDIILLPIPFTDLSSRKVRPAIVIGFGSHPGDLFLIPLTSQLASANFALADWQAAGLMGPRGHWNAALVYLGRRSPGKM